MSFLDEKGIPAPVECALICPPKSQIGPITPDQRQQLIGSSLVAGVYEKAVDRESAYERLKGRAAQQPTPATQRRLRLRAGSRISGSRVPAAGVGTRSRRAAMKSAARAMGSSVGRQIIRGVLGFLLGGTSRR